MTKSDSPPRYQAYLLRFWETRSQEEHNGPAAWRFSLEHPHTGVRRGFADLEALMAFLESETGEDTPATV